MNQQYSDNMQNGPITPPVKRTRRARVEATQTSRNDRIHTRALTSLLKQNNETNNSKAEVPAHYAMTDQRNLVNQANQILYPNMMHVPTTTSYSMPQQLAQPTNYITMNAQPVGQPKVNNSPHVSPSTMSRYWNTPRPPVSQQRQRAQQMNTPAPVERPLPKQIKEESTQTDFSISEGEVKLIKSLRSRGLNISKLNIILEKGDYIVTYDEKPPEKEAENEEQAENGNAIESETYNKIIRYSDVGKGQIFSYMACSLEMQRRAILAGQHILNSRPAIQYQMPINHASTSHSSPPGFSGTQQQVPQQIPETPPQIHESFPIPTISNFYNNFHSRRHANNQGGAQYPRVPNIPANLLQASAFYNSLTHPNFYKPPWG